MTEQKPVAWIYEYDNGSQWVHACEQHPPFGMAVLIRNVVPLYKHPAPPTEQKPVAWACEYRSGFSPNNWLTDLSEHRLQECETIRNVRPLYEHPAPSQPATDPAVEAARRKALRAVFRAIDATTGYSDLYSVRLATGVLRDLVGLRRDDTRVRIRGYDEEPDVVVSGPPRETHINTADLAKRGEPMREMPIKPAGAYGPDDEPDLKVSAPMNETRVNTADLAQKDAAPPALLSVGMLASIIRNRAGLCLCVIDTKTCAAIATAVHEAVYSKVGK